MFVSRLASTVQRWSALRRSFNEVKSILNVRKLYPAVNTISFYDELHYDHSKTGHFSEVVKSVKSNPNREMNERAVAYLLFNMGISQVTDEVIGDMVDTYVERFRGKYEGRIAFGALSGGLRVNIQPKTLRVFLEDFLPEKDNMKVMELLNILDSLTVNKSLPFEERQEIFKEAIEPRLAKKANGLRFAPPLGQIALRGLIGLQRVEGPLFDKVITFYTSPKSAMNLERQVEAYQLLTDYLKQHYSATHLQKHIDEIKKRILSFETSRWGYNVHEMREYTYDELMARREQERFPGQSFPYTLIPEYRANWEEIKARGFDYKDDPTLGMTDVEKQIDGMTDEELLALVQSGKVLEGEDDLEAIQVRFIWVLGGQNKADIQAQQRELARAAVGSTKKEAAPNQQKQAALKDKAPEKGGKPQQAAGQANKGAGQQGKKPA